MQQSKKVNIFSTSPHFFFFFFLLFPNYEYMELILQGCGKKTRLQSAVHTIQTNAVMHARSMHLHRFGFSHTLWALLLGLEGNQNHIQQSVFPQGQAVSILLKGELLLWASGGICQLCRFGFFLFVCFVLFFFSCVPWGNSRRVLLFPEIQILSSLSRWPWGLS